MPADTETANFISKVIPKAFEIAEEILGDAVEDFHLKIKTAYKTYNKNTKNHYSKSKSFFIRDASVDLYEYYVPISIECDSHFIENPNFINTRKKSNRIIIAGNGGTGKSVLMKHLFLDCFKNNHVPIIIELRDLNNENYKLIEYIKKTLDDYSFFTHDGYYEKAIQNNHFAFFLDGYDEVDHEHRSKLLKEIKTLSQSIKDCPLYISTRPDEALGSLNEFNVYQILPLNVNSATKLIEKLPYDETIKLNFILDLKSDLFNKNESFLSNPLLLSIMLLTYGENAEIPSKRSIFYEQAYETLFNRHDAIKGGYNRKRLSKLDSRDFARVFATFCLKTYDERKFKISKLECIDIIEKSKKYTQLNFKPEDYLEDTLKAVCLMIEDGLFYTFSHRSFQEYFVARFIKDAEPELQKKLIEKYFDNIGSDSVFSLLYEMDRVLVEKTLFIPRLNKMFKNLKINKNVGVTHKNRLMKMFYKDIIIDANSISATFIKGINPYMRLMSMIVNYYTTKERDGVDYEQKHQKIYRKYCKNKKSLKFNVKDLSYRHPFFIEISDGFSMRDLEPCYKILKNLEKNRKNADKNLDSLLGN